MKPTENQKKSQSVYRLKDILLVILGSFIVGAGVQLFYVPGNILGGGITAISIMLHILTGSNVAIATFFLNIPILALGYFMVNRQFMLYSTLGMIGMTAFMKLLEQVPAPSDSLFTCIVCGGLLVGGGGGLMLKYNGSGAGTDVICRIINKYTSFQIGSVSLSINAFLVFLAAFFLNLDIAIATITTLFITSRVVNYILDGMNYKRMVLVVTDKGEDIALALSSEFGRGATISHVTGAYLGREQSQVMCTINIHETPRLKGIVLKLDPQAFISMFEVTAVIGSSFKKKRHRFLKQK
ncbi:YitT family protein [Aminipila luticellarii]|uniref:YitT family protein n=1 Tax=Aminipila luticellarii TaxID=2507160 RepID=A0A410PYJ2_9FIRM|nr:YitT family protein [Aminipila luticellarii]QAT43954.1 YitT family protein [Aminipila luticellarii]